MIASKYGQLLLLCGRRLTEHIASTMWRHGIAYRLRFLSWRIASGHGGDGGVDGSAMRFVAVKVAIIPDTCMCSRTVALNWWRYWDAETTARGVPLKPFRRQLLLYVITFSFYTTSVETDLIAYRGNSWTFDLIKVRYNRIYLQYFHYGLMS
jgi:hypothetical protein